MKAICVIEKPGQVEATISFTMTLKEWKGLRDQLKVYTYPACEIMQAIDSLTRQVEERFYPKPDPSDITGTKV